MIKYKKRKVWKYVTWEDYTIFLPGIFMPDYDSKYLVVVGALGGINLTIRTSYRWDGPSGPTFDSLRLLPKRFRAWAYKSFMRGSLVHDALYQLMREALLERIYRKRADEVLREVCLSAGMMKVRARYVYRGVRAGAAKAVADDLLTAP